MQGDAAKVFEIAKDAILSGDWNGYLYDNVSLNPPLHHALTAICIRAYQHSHDADNEQVAENVELVKRDLLTGWIKQKDSYSKLQIGDIKDTPQFANPRLQFHSAEEDIQILNTLWRVEKDVLSTNAVPYVDMQDANGDPHIPVMQIPATILDPVREALTQRVAKTHTSHTR